MNKEKITAAIWSALGGAVLTMIVGFSWGGWVLGSTSTDLGETMARNAVTERLAPICVAMYEQDALKSAKLIELEEYKSWNKEEYVKDQGWATMPFEKEADDDVAERCSVLILAQK